MLFNITGCTVSGIAAFVIDLRFQIAGLRFFSVDLKLPLKLQSKISNLISYFIVRLYLHPILADPFQNATLFLLVPVQFQPVISDRSCGTS